jgi:hypothetical protein
LGLTERRVVFGIILAVATFLWGEPLEATSQQPPDPADVTSWSGTWEGTSERIPAGTCAAGGLQKPMRTRVVLKIEPDGSAVAGERPLGGGIEDGKALWRGRVEKDLKMRLVGPATASCDGHARAYQIEYRGRFKKKKDIWRLEIEGQDNGCADQGCTFTRALKLTRP